MPYFESQVEQIFEASFFNGGSEVYYGDVFDSVVAEVKSEIFDAAIKDLKKFGLKLQHGTSGLTLEFAIDEKGRHRLSLSIFPATSTPGWAKLKKPAIKKAFPATIAALQKHNKAPEVEIAINPPIGFVFRVYLAGTMRTSRVARPSSIPAELGD